MLAKVISVINMKGGVGKTTLSCNIAIELAERGYKVLVIDSDPQFNSTQTLFKYYDTLKKYNDLEESGKTLRGIFNSDKSFGMHGKEQRDEFIYNLKLKNSQEGKLDIIPGDLKLIVDINNQASDMFKSYFNRNKLKNKYDYIIIDCPPTWGQLTSVSLDISDYYLIPTRLDEFSTIGITLLSELIGEKVAANPDKLKCLGVVYMMLNITTGASGISLTQEPFKRDIEDYFEDMEDIVKSEVKSFDQYFYHKQPMATKSVVYRDQEGQINLKKRLNLFIDELEERVK